MTTTLFLMVGDVGAGKSTRAKALARETPALRLTPDDWMMPLFGHPDLQEQRAVLEGLLLLTAVDALRLGVDVILDFGLWSRSERAALHWMAASAGATARTVWLSVDPETQWQRVEQRWAQGPADTWRATREDLARWSAQVEEPDEADLAGRPDPTPPQPHETWATWIAQR
jgi:predicted kinase